MKTYLITGKASGRKSWIVAKDAADAQALCLAYCAKHGAPYADFAAAFEIAELVSAMDVPADALKHPASRQAAPLTAADHQRHLAACRKVWAPEDRTKGWVGFADCVDGKTYTGYEG